MQPSRTKSISRNSKPFRRIAIALVALFAVVAAVSPAAAATSFAGLDSGMLAMVLAFATLLFAVVIEVWRLGVHQHQPARNSATEDWKTDKR